MTEKLMGLDVMRFALKDKPWMGTVSARREALPLHAGDLVLLRVLWIVSHPVNARNRNCIARFEYSANLRHDRILSVLGAFIGKVSISDVARMTCTSTFYVLGILPAIRLLFFRAASEAWHRFACQPRSFRRTRHEGSRSGCLIVFS